MPAAMAERHAAQGLGALYDATRAQLGEAGIETAALDARIFVQEATGLDQTALLLRPETPVEDRIRERLCRWVARRLAGEPVFRILGWREFHGLRLRLSPGTLEPRPDTETLVEHALPLLRAAAGRQGHARLLDLGTGTGAIALALLAREPRASAVGADISRDALATARQNAEDHGLEARFSCVLSRWFAEIDGKFDLIISNPPYIVTGEILRLAPEVRLHDPVAALDGGPDGLDAYREISARALDFLAGDGHLLVEIGSGQQEAVRTIFEANGFEMLDMRADLRGIIRSLSFRRSETLNATAKNAWQPA